MKVYGRSAVSEFLGDRIVYRNLVPSDPRLPPLEAISRQIGLPAGVIPRKSEPEYARVIAELLRQARRSDMPGATIERIIFIGDTHLLDATAFSNICQMGNWPGLAFIGAENSAQPEVKTVRMTPDQVLYLSNRWVFLRAESGDETGTSTAGIYAAGFMSFPTFCSANGFPIDEGTALLVDLDKTAIGARGRNAQVIDQARLQAVQDTVAGLLEESFDQDAFQEAYRQLSQPEFHSFTADNQDYLAYVCLILGSRILLGGGFFDLGWLLEEIRAGRMGSFQQFIALVDDRKAALSGGWGPCARLGALHDEIYAYVQASDPTPFKAFRTNEYLATVGRMGVMDDLAPVESLLAEEIVITQEVRELALAWKERGALVFGLSDKPDEASVPTPERAARGYLPLHRQETHAIGG